MKWGAIMNTFPTNDKIKQMDKIFPNNGKWHTIFEEKDFAVIDGKEVRKKDSNKWT